MLNRTLVLLALTGLARPQVVSILSPQSVVTVAGGGESGTISGSNNGVGTNVGFAGPYGVAIGSSGVLYVADTPNHKIRAVFSNRSVITLAGGGVTGSSYDSGSVNGVGTNGLFNGPNGITVSTMGVLYIADAGNNKIRFILPNATVGTLAGGGSTGSQSGSTDGIGTAALFNSPCAVAIDAMNVVFVVDFYHKIRRIAAFTAWSSPTTATVTTLAGGGSAGGISSGSADGMGTNALFGSPKGVAVGSAGIVFVADSGNDKIRAIAPDGTVTTLAGGGGTTGTMSGNNDAMGTAALFNTPYGLAIDMSGVLYVADQSNNKVRKIFPNATVITIAGGFTTGVSSGSVNGIGTAALFSGPSGIAVNSSNSVIYVSDTSNHKLRAIFPFTCSSGQYITDYTSDPKCAPCLPGSYSDPADYFECPPCAAGTFSSDFGAASCTPCPVGTFTPTDGASACLRSPAIPQSVVTVAGGGASGTSLGSNNGVGTNVGFENPFGVAIGSSGILYVADFNNNKIRAVFSNRSVITIAGGGVTGTTSGSVNGVGTNGLINSPWGIIVSTTGILYIADFGNSKIRFILPNATVGTLAGGGSMGGVWGSTDGFGTAALFLGPTAVTIDAMNVVFVADSFNHKIRRIATFTAWSSPTTATVTTLAGGSAGLVDGIGTNARFDSPQGIAVGSTGIVFVADGNNNKIRAIAPDGTVTTLAGGSTTGAVSGNNDAMGTAALFRYPYGLAIDMTGTLYVADQSNNKVRKIFPNATVITIAGGDSIGFYSDSVNGIGTSAFFYAPSGIAVNSSNGVVYVSDTSNHKLRAIFPFACSSGQYITDYASNPKCAPCLPGSYSDPADYRECTLCPIGTYSNTLGANSNTTCLPCPCPSSCTSLGMTIVPNCSSSPTRTPSQTLSASNIVTPTPTQMPFSSASVSNSRSTKPSDSHLSTSTVRASLSSTASVSTSSASVSSSESASARDSLSPSSYSSSRASSLASSSSSLSASRSPPVSISLGKSISTSASPRPSITTTSTTSVSRSGAVSRSPTASLLSTRSPFPSLPPTSSIQTSGTASSSPWTLTAVISRTASISVASPSARLTVSSTHSTSTSQSPVISTLPTPATPLNSSTPVLTMSSSPSPSLSRSPRTSTSGTTSALQTRSPSATAVPSRSPARSASASISSSLSRSSPPTPSASISAFSSLSSAKTLSSTSTSTLTATPSQTRTTSSTPSETPTTTPSPTASSTRSPDSLPSTSPTRSSSLTPSATPTPTPSAPSFSCLVRAEGCTTPIFKIGVPSLADGSPVGAIAPIGAVVAWPAVRSTITVTFPEQPSTAETLRVSCGVPTPSGKFIVITTSGGADACVGATAGAACVLVDSTSDASVTFLLFASPPTASSMTWSNVSTSGTLTCSVVSTGQTRFTGELPRYGASTSFTAPAISLPTSWPFIDLLLSESNAVAGLFSSIAGAGLGKTWKLTAANLTVARGGATPLPPDCADLVTVDGNSTAVEWSASTLPLCTPALSAVASVISAARARGGSPSLSAPLSSSMHWIIVARPGSPFSPSLVISLGGVPCAINWVSPDGAFASVSTPSYSALCASSGAGSTATDCGVAQLVLSGHPWSVPSILAVASEGRVGDAAALSLPLYFATAYAPTLVGFDWGAAYAAARADTAYARSGILPSSSPFNSLGAIAIGSTGALVSAAASASTGVGFRVLQACTDPIYESATVCSAAAAASVFKSISGCPYGAGDQCRPCPVGAMCPGGFTLLPLPGYWIPLSTSGPGDLVKCQEPGASARCPGWRDVSTSSSMNEIGCGSGYRGPGCAACSPRFFLGSGECTACPELGAGALLAVIGPILLFVGVLLGASAILIYVVHLLGATWKNAAIASASIAAWLWMAGQSSASAFRVTQAFAPKYVAKFYVALTSLQFQGISLPPACYSSPPYMDAYVAGGVGLLLMLTVALSAVVISHEPVSQAVEEVAKEGSDGDGDGNGNDAPQQAQQTHFRALAIACTLLKLGYGPMSAAFSDTLACDTPSTQPVRVYLNLAHDGAALRAALDNPSSPVSAALSLSLLSGSVAGLAKATVSDLERAVGNPVYSAAYGLDAALSAPISFALVLSDSFSVCFEGAHRPAWITSAFVGFLIIFGLPALGLWAANVLTYQCAGRLASRIMHYTMREGATREPDAPVVAPARTAFDTLQRAVLTSLVDVDIRRDSTWIPAAQQTMLVTLSVSASFAARATSTVTFSGLMGLSIIAPLLYAGAALWKDPYRGSARWKGPAEAALAILSAVTAGCSLVIFLSRGDDRVGSTVSIVPLVIALTTVSAILRAWWVATAMDARKQKLIAEGGGDGRDGRVADGRDFVPETTNPLRLQSRRDQQRSDVTVSPALTRFLLDNPLLKTLAADEAKRRVAASMQRGATAQAAAAETAEDLLRILNQLKDAEDDAAAVRRSEERHTLEPVVDDDDVASVMTVESVATDDDRDAHMSRGAWRPIAPSGSRL